MRGDIEMLVKFVMVNKIINYMKKLLLSVAVFMSVSLCMAQTPSWQTLGDTVVYTNAKVGINTSEPKEALHVNGYVRGEGPGGALRINTDYGITTIGAVSGNYSHFNTTKPRFYFYQPIMINGGQISSSSGTNLYLQTFLYDGSNLNPTTRMTILNSNGNVGIGKTNPLQRLDVAGNIRASDSILGTVVKVLRAKVISTLESEAITNNYFMTNNIYAQGSVLNVNASTLHCAGKIRATDSIIGTVIKTTWAKTSQLESTGVTSSYLAAYSIAARSNVLTVSAPTLDCSGKIRANEIIVNSTNGADFVFEHDYNLRSLDDVSSYIQENKHLPEIPSAKQMQEEGMSVDQMVVKLLQKVEELTLYTIQQEERIKELEKNQK